MMGIRVYHKNQLILPCKPSASITASVTRRYFIRRAVNEVDDTTFSASKSWEEHTEVCSVELAKECASSFSFPSLLLRWIPSRTSPWSGEMSIILSQTDCSDGSVSVVEAEESTRMTRKGWNHELFPIVFSSLTDDTKHALQAGPKFETDIYL